MKQIIKIEPIKSKDDKKTVFLRMVLVGEKGAIQFGAYIIPKIGMLPSELGCYSKTPISPDSEYPPVCGTCEYFSGEAYYCSYVGYDDAFALLQEKGTDAVWVFLEDFYKRFFD